MSSGDGSDLVALIVSEVGKQVPIRQALGPAATEIGGLVSDLVKCVRLALAPVQYLAVQQERYRRFIEKSAESVPASQRVQPAAQILGPILEGIRYEPEGSISDQAFSELLNRAFDRERVNQAHPAFPTIIRAMADDEMRLFQQVKAGPIAVRLGSMSDTEFTRISATVERPEFDYLASPQQVSAYAIHLEALGLIHDLEAKKLGDTDVNCPYDLYFVLTISDFGELFANAVFNTLSDSDSH
jgi:Abortive infection alpha